MTKENHDHDWHDNDWHDNDRKTERDPLDRALDASLAKYSAVEPRTGLEDRVLANLQAEPDYVLTRSWWRWSLVPASAIFAAVVIIVASLAGRSGKTHSPVSAHHSTTIAPVFVQSGAQSGQRNTQDGSVRSTANGADRNDLAQSFRPAERHAMHQAAANAHPKLDQFPSPQPLSEQEKILAGYVQKYPENAVLLARARTEALRKDQLEETGGFQPRSWDTDSEDTNSDTTNR